MALAMLPRTSRSLCWCHCGRSRRTRASSVKSISTSRSAARTTTIANGRLVRGGVNGGDQEQEHLDPLILVVSAGLGPQSLVTRASRGLLDALRFDRRTVEHDLWSDALISYNVSHMAAKMRLLKGKGTAEDEELFLPIHRMAEELNAASVLVVSSPIWNFSFPYVLKQYVDIAVQPGINFHEGNARGFAAGRAAVGFSTENGADTAPVTCHKHLVLVTSRGGSVGGTRDHFGLYLSDIFGMLGFTRVHEISMSGAMTTPKDVLLERAQEEVSKVADILNEDFGVLHS